MIEPVDIIIPTYDNANMLCNTVKSMLATRLCMPMRIIIVNNGHPGINSLFSNIEDVTIIQSPTNVGWEGGLKLGLEKSKSKLVMFANDDLFVPVSSLLWLRNMCEFFINPNVGAVGPSSNVVMGKQNIFTTNGERFCAERAAFLIGFCMLLRREALDKSGGVDQTMPGGDDIDLSIRLRDNGYHLIIDRRSFVWHHGFQTGNRVYGGPDKPGGWNSEQMTERTNFALIKKHGFRKWYETLHFTVESRFDSVFYEEDVEGNSLKKYISGIAPEKILEIGCGGKKTVPGSVGVDMVSRGTRIDTIDSKSVADVQAEACNLPASIGKFDAIVARHLIEHLHNPIKAIKHWKNFLTEDGIIIIVCPDDSFTDTIPLNPEHRHACTKEFISDLMKVCGMNSVEVFPSGNGISMVCVASNKQLSLSERLCV